MDKHGFFIFGTGNSLYATIVEGSRAGRGAAAPLRS